MGPPTGKEEEEPSKSGSVSPTLLDDQSKSHKYTVGASGNIDGPSTIFTERMTKILCGTHPDLLSREDLFHELREELGLDLLQYMDLDADQTEVVKQAAESPGGITLYQGPPGTGKTRLFLQAMIPFLLCARSPQQVLILAPTNLMADGLAKTIHDMIQNLSMRYHNMQGKYAVRIYSRATDCLHTSLQAQVATTQIGDVKQSQTKPPTEEVISLFGASPSISQAILDAHQESRVYPTQGSPDLHFKFSEHSPNRYMLESTESIDSIGTWSEVLQKASIIVSTTAGASSRDVLQAIEHTTTAIVLECATSENEANYTSLFAARFQRNPGVLVIGDRHPLPPRLSVDANEKGRVRQSQVDFVTRMAVAGHACHNLHNQYRMSPAIAEPLNGVIYGNQLVNDLSTDAKHRPLTGPFKQFLNKNFAKGYLSSIWINTARLGHVESRDEVHSDIVLQMVEPLLKIVDGDKPDAVPGKSQVGSGKARAGTKSKPKRSPPRIAIIALCENQKEMYVLAKAQMMQQNVKHIENLHIVNTDTAQSLEWDYVFVDLCLDSVAKSTVESPRLHVALTRARDGLVIIGDTVQVDGMKGIQFLKELKKFYVKHSRVHYVKEKNCITWPQKTG